MQASKQASEREIILDLTIYKQAATKPPRPTWGNRRYTRGVDPQKEASQPPEQADAHTAISQLAQRITEHGRPSQRFHESPQLRELRQRARSATGGEAREPGIQNPVRGASHPSKQNQLGGVQGDSANQGESGVATRAHGRLSMGKQACSPFSQHLCQGPNPPTTRRHPEGPHAALQKNPLEAVDGGRSSVCHPHVEAQQGNWARLHHP